MARDGLTFDGRGLLRWLVEQENGKAEVAESAAREELYKAGLIVRGSSATTFEATAAGTECAKRIVRESGDGPEALKALFDLGPGR